MNSYLALWGDLISLPRCRFLWKCHPRQTQQNPPWLARGYLSGHTHARTGTAKHQEATKLPTSAASLSNQYQHT